MVYIVFTKSWLNPASNICDVSCSEKKRKENGTARTSFIGEYVGGPVALVHRAVADPAAQHHAEDHLEDLTNKRWCD